MTSFAASGTADRAAAAAPASRQSAQRTGFHSASGAPRPRAKNVGAGSLRFPDTRLRAPAGAASAIADIGLGPDIGPDGDYAGLPDVAKWILTVTMLIGRLEVLSVFVLFSAGFWRA